MSSLTAVACLDCGQDFTLARTASKMRCFCGSDNLVYEALTLVDEIEAMDKGFVVSPYPVGPANGLGPDQLRAITPYFQVGHVLSHEEEVALGIVPEGSDLAPTYALVAVKTSALGTSVAADNPFPPKKKKDDDDKGGDDKGGNETHPPVEDPAAGGAAPAPAPGTPPATTGEGTEAPGEVQVDPNAPPAPGAVPGQVADPLLQAMDTAQAQVDAAVDQANQLGHDAKEVAYDVDQLFSNWRCQNCQIEGEANISDDGQTDLQGDLFDMQPCAAPAPADPNQNQEAQQPQQAQQNQLPQGAPATNDQIPATQQGIPSQTSAKRPGTGTEYVCGDCNTWFKGHGALVKHQQSSGHKTSSVTASGKTCATCHGRGKDDSNSKCTDCNGQGYTSTGESLDKKADTTDLPQVQDDKQQGPNQRNVADQQAGEIEAVTAMVEKILDSNPGMNVQAARRLAERTLAKFPSLAPKNASSLNDKMDFDHVIQVLPGGQVVDARGVYAPELNDEHVGGGWSLMDGYSGQSGYSGPIMHSSEFIGGGLERDILAQPGYYVTLVAYGDYDEEPDGWAVAYKSA
jgi:hypothetical protein